MSDEDLTVRIPVRMLKWMGFWIFAGTALLEWLLWAFEWDTTKVFDFPSSPLGWTCAAIYYHALYLAKSPKGGTDAADTRQGG